MKLESDSELEAICFVRIFQSVFKCIIIAHEWKIPSMINVQEADEHRTFQVIAFNFYCYYKSMWTYVIYNVQHTNYANGREREREKDAF